MTKRGAQPGNQNALKHGFYSKTFMLQDLTDLEEQDTGIEGEILIARIITKRLMNLYKEAENIGAQISILTAAGEAATRVASLKRVQKIISGGDSNVLSTIQKAIEEVNLEFENEKANKRRTNG